MQTMPEQTVAVILWREDTSEISALAVCATELDASHWLFRQRYTFHFGKAARDEWYERINPETRLTERAIIRLVPWISPELSAQGFSATHWAPMRSSRQVYGDDNALLAGEDPEEP